MSQHSMEMISCPSCKKESEFLVWNSINTTLDPEMKDKVRTGEAFLWQCPSCGTRRIVEYPMLYHQMEDHMMIWFMPGDAQDAVEHFEKLRQGEDPAAAAAPDYRYRAVTSRYALREKLLLFDEGLDDRVAELAKPFAHKALSQEYPELDVEEIRYDQSPDGELMTGFRLTDGRWAYLPFDRPLYARVRDFWSEALKEDEDTLIDANWARGFLKEHEEEVRL
ncbi:MAG: CpXC domain-containing protein [Oscillospiraceae bacterium]|nr:CpXC domain-containing protein [Oscillospiraceae bacterium]